MTIKIISLNLWLGGELFNNVLQFLRDRDADVIILQEVYNGTDDLINRQYRSMQVLKDQLSYPYEDFVPDYLDITRADGKAQRGNAILSRFPITERDHIFLYGAYTEKYQDIPGYYHECPRNLQHVRLETPAGEVNVFNVQGIYDMDGDNYSEQRRKMSKTIIDRVKDMSNVILAGDTNAKPTNKAIQDIEKYLSSIFGTSLASTFNMKRKDSPGYAAAAVDMIFVSPNIKVLEKECPDVDISDHLPLVVRLDV